MDTKYSSRVINDNFTHFLNDDFILTFGLKIFVIKKKSVRHVAACRPFLSIYPSTEIFCHKKKISFVSVCKKFCCMVQHFD